MSKFTTIVSAVGAGIAIVAPRLPGCGLISSVLMKLGVLKNVDRISTAIEAVAKNDDRKTAKVVEATCGSLATATALFMLISGTAPAVVVIILWMIGDLLLDSTWNEFEETYELCTANS